MTVTFQPSPVGLVTIESKEPPTAIVVVLHGSGGNGSNLQGLAEQWTLALPYVKFLLPSAPLFTHSSKRQPTSYWYQLDTKKKPIGIEMAWCGVLEALEHSCLQYNVPLSRVAFVGFSLGSSFASFVALQLPEACAGVAMLSGGVPHKLMNIPDWSKKTAVLICGGTNDPVVSFDKLKQYSYNFLRDHGFKVEWQEYQGQGHTISEREISDVGMFLQLWLPRTLPTPIPIYQPQSYRKPPLTTLICQLKTKAQRDHKSPLA